MARYLIGIDLGTTNSALAFVDRRAKPAAGGPVLHTFNVPQLVAAGEVAARPLLPSFYYRPGPHDLPPGAVALPWNAAAADAVGTFARTHGAKVPGRLVSSAKSWLCHPGVDRTAPLLPWAAPPDVPRLSPLEVTTAYLKHLADAWNHAKGKDPHDRIEEQPVVVTVPASFDDDARRLTAEAATKAGFKNFSLLEEPQAAFYAWLGTHPPAEATKIKPGMRCLVVDVGGGTSDFSLIRAAEGRGELQFLRDAVGEHLLLGGDNMDLAIAKFVEAKLPGGRVDAAQFGTLVQACRSAKEALLSDPPPESYPVTVMGKGRSVVGGTLSIPLTAEDLKTVLFDGFFPAVPFESDPNRAAKSGLQEMGLPYVADAAITKHLAAFVRKHVPPGETVDAVLFNGGVFQPDRLRQRLIDVLAGWFPAGWSPLVLTSPSLDLAVAWGAAYFAWLKQSGGARIGGGVPRAYYLGVDGGAAGRKSVVCVVPRGMNEGDEVLLSEPKLELAIGQPALFPLFSSTVRGNDAAGQLLTLDEDQLLPLAPLHTVLRGGKRAGAKRVPVTLAAKCTEIGTLELACVTPEGNRWKLEFNVREVAKPEGADDKPAAVTDVWPEEKVQAGAAVIRDVFDAGTVPATDAVKVLEAALEANRSDWPTGLCRRMWEFLADAADGRAKSPQHLARWYNLAGFVLRPGFGDPLDKYRVEAVWKLLNATAAGGTAAGGADYWVLWRRLAGGLNAPQQANLFGQLKPVLLPSKKNTAKPPANELAEMWRAAASLERLDLKTKDALGAALVKLTKKDAVPQFVFWSLTRVAARRPLYGPLNAVVHPQVVEPWLTELIAFRPTTEQEKHAWGFCLANAARRTGVRAVDVSDDVRDGVAKLLDAEGMKPEWATMVREVTETAGEDRGVLFGEALPIGLRLVG